MLLHCTLAGYPDRIDAESIVWSFMGQRITRSDKYILSVSNNEECPPYIACGIAFLQISDLNSSDDGDYTCSFEELSRTITLFRGKRNVHFAL